MRGWETRRHSQSPCPSPRPSPRKRGEGGGSPTQKRARIKAVENIGSVQVLSGADFVVRADRPELV